MKINFNDVKLNLVNFFIKSQGYKSSKFDNEYTSYLTSTKKEYKVIRISIGETLEQDKNLEELKKEIKTAERQSISVLTIILGEKTNGLPLENTIYINDPEAYISALKELFPKIVNLKIEKEDVNQDVNMTDEDIMDALKDPENSTDPEFKKVAKKLKNSAPFLAYLFVFFFGIGPIIITFLNFIFPSIPANNQIQSLIFGGIDHNLTVLGNQWWRILTWGVVFGGDNYSVLSIMLFGLINSFVLYGFALYSENVIDKRKLFVTVLLTYVLTGFFTAVFTLEGVVGGYPAILASLFSAVGVSTMQKKTTLTVISKTKMIYPGFWLFMSPLFLMNMSNYITIIVALAISMAIAFLLEYDFKKTSGFVILPFLLLLAPIVSGIIGIFILPYHQSVDYLTLNTLALYGNLGWMDIDTMENIFGNLHWNVIVTENSAGSFVFIIME